MSLLFAPSRPERISVLRADAELGPGLDDRRRADAERASAAVLIRREAGVWDARADAAAARDGAGLLVVDGMLVRRVGVADRYGAELLGPGDILQPWQHDGEEATVPFDATWRVLGTLRLAVLDLGWLKRMAPFPEVAAALVARGLMRSRRLATMQAISQQRALDQRLILLLWELADRYGHVIPGGVELRLGLTHEMLGYLAGARRPSISASLGRLERQGRLDRSSGSWLLRGGAPISAALPRAEDLTR